VRNLTAAYELIARPVLEFYGSLNTFEALRSSSSRDAILLMLITSGLAHLPPMKVVTILSGAAAVNIWLFIASAIVADDPLVSLATLADGLAVEGPDEAGLGGHPAVDRVRGEVVLKHDRSAPHAGQDRHRVVGVRHHQVGEVGRAEVRGQPQPDLGVAVRGDGARRHKPEGGDRLVQFEVAHRLQRRQQALLRGSNSRSAHAPVGCGEPSPSTSCAPGVPADAGSWNSSGTLMS